MDWREHLQLSQHCGLATERQNTAQLLGSCLVLMFSLSVLIPLFQSDSSGFITLGTHHLSRGWNNLTTLLTHRSNCCALSLTYFLFLINVMILLTPYLSQWRPKDQHWHKIWRRQGCYWLGKLLAQAWDITPCKHNRSVLHLDSLKRIKVILFRDSLWWFPKSFVYLYRTSLFTVSLADFFLVPRGEKKERGNLIAGVNLRKKVVVGVKP